MINKKIRVLLAILIIIATCRISIIKVKADNQFEWSEGITSTDPTDPVKPLECKCPEGYTASSGLTKVGTSCGTPKTYIIKLTGKVGYNLFDLNDNSTITNKNTKIFAGTSVGVSLYELRGVTWLAKAAYVTTYSCDCQKCTTTLGKECIIEDAYGRCRKWLPVKNTNCQTATGYASQTSLSTVTETSNGMCDEVARIAGYNFAVEEIKKLGPSYKVTIGDPNDTRCNNDTVFNQEFEREVKDLGYASINQYCTSKDANIVGGEPSGYYSNPVTKNYYYEMAGACINAKNAKVRYLNSTLEKCENDEIYLENKTDSEQIRHWHFFTPLNAKETDNYKFTMESTGNVLSKEACLDIINNYPTTYSMYIVPVKMPSNKTFGQNLRLDRDVYIEEGCKLATQLELPIIQRFYNEEKESEEKSLLNGFNLYYRQIDITNPFPNGFTSTFGTESIWKKWCKQNQCGNNTFEDSYDKVTYYTNNINSESVRKNNATYELDNNGNPKIDAKGKYVIRKYTSWEEMNLNGTSEYIDSGGVIVKTANAKSVYKLGCGPANKDWEECKR